MPAMQMPVYSFTYLPLYRFVTCTVKQADLHDLLTLTSGAASDMMGILKGHEAAQALCHLLVNSSFILSPHFLPDHIHTQYMVANTDLDLC